MLEFRAEAITAGYGGPPILDAVSVTASAGQVSVVLGPNGAGKSTLAKAVVGLLPIRNGRVYLNDVDVTELGPHKLVRRGLAYLPQLLNVFGRMSVVENLEMGGYTVRGGLQTRVESVLDTFPDLAKDRRKRASTLSVGQQRMMALARLLMTDPIVAILDEPTAGLSPLYAERVWDQITRIRDRGVALFVIEQNAQMAMERANSVFILAGGRNMLSGRAADLLDHDEVTKILVG